MNKLFKTVQKCQKVSKNVKKCQKMSKNVKLFNFTRGQMQFCERVELPDDTKSVAFNILLGKKSNRF